MSPAEPAQPVGDAPCPIEGCSETVKLYRYREQSSRGSMFKGKFYARCSRHGRVIEASSSSFASITLLPPTRKGDDPDRLSVRHAP